DQAIARLKALGEPVVEIATMTGLPVSTVRSALARAASIPEPSAPADAGTDGGPPQAAPGLTHPVQG
ncbi:MAG: sigma-70 region 4 domain-containing protein, partial [Micromonosporaceae bacterium]|nr:sigma-70 region 4 domain-containing protein [Micromonosporaceae bacterium]